MLENAVNSGAPEDDTRVKVDDLRWTFVDLELYVSDVSLVVRGSLFITISTTYKLYFTEYQPDPHVL